MKGLKNWFDEKVNKTVESVTHKAVDTAVKDVKAKVGKNAKDLKPLLKVAAIAAVVFAVNMRTTHQTMYKTFNPDYFDMVKWMESGMGVKIDNGVPALYY